MPFDEDIYDQFQEMIAKIQNGSQPSAEPSDRGEEVCKTQNQK